MLSVLETAGAVTMLIITIAMFIMYVVETLGKRLDALGKSLRDAVDRSVGELRESVGELRESVGELQDKVDLLLRADEERKREAQRKPFGHWW
jgi:Mg2+ and Co2+ transporter CorA